LLRVSNLILVVDSDAIERRYISALLAADGFSVTQVDRAVDGMVAITAIEPSLVILAVGRGMAVEEARLRLPQLVRIFRRITNAPVAIIGDPESSDEIEALVSGGDIFLPRGFGASELISRARMLTRREGNAFRSARMQGGAAASTVTYAQVASAIVSVLSEEGAPNGRQAA
jgi:DNA-binding response OmpR family regulator